MAPAGLVLNAIRTPQGHEAKKWLEKPFVSTNHFDVDALTSVWAYLYRELALEYADGAVPCFPPSAFVFHPPSNDRPWLQSWSSWPTWATSAKARSSIWTRKAPR